ncbi:hypothetical protein F2P81_022015 [Scophthalmus maximus]|uniref:Uncharacterized protein n=1 Tax=Scophthalmus maximus TaxID=52904 RepID=A0A6A4S3M9_SCOMX|nr:hypothetical protein F2P81_022015 [Scophthalmus maximus]
METHAPRAAVDRRLVLTPGERSGVRTYRRTWTRNFHLRSLRRPPRHFSRTVEMCIPTLLHLCRIEPAPGLSVTFRRISRIRLLHKHRHSLHWRSLRSACWPEDNAFGETLRSTMRGGMFSFTAMSVHLRSLSMKGLAPSGNRPGLPTRREDDGLTARLRERPGPSELDEKIDTTEAN